MFDLLDSSVQILKGPQGTLYGRNATGGAILINSADPTTTEEVRVAAEGGSEGHALGEIVANVPLSDTLQIRFAAREKHDGSYINNLHDGTKFGQTTSGEGRMKIRWAPTDDFTAVFGLDHSDTANRAGATAERASAPNCAACAIPGSGAPVAGFFNTKNDTNTPIVTRDTCRRPANWSTSRRCRAGGGRFNTAAPQATRGEARPMEGDPGA